MGPEAPMQARGLGAADARGVSHQKDNPGNFSVCSMDLFLLKHLCHWFSWKKSPQ